ncbi:hypothetical protein CEQ90_01745 [Lewinellaceae bacterium SD302]|nr:hypothetical protein CEQ90_01745 [Lewinellaceae bacterium SD302]
MPNRFKLVASLLTFLLASSLIAQVNRPSSAGLPTDVPRANFNSREVGLLNEANRLLRFGRTEEAIMSYDAILGIRPNWLPGIVGKAELLNRIGRTAEADRYKQRALRQDPIATGLLMARGRNALLSYLALYPESELPVPVLGDDVDDVQIADFSLESYFDQQLRRIIDLPDSSALAMTLKAKIAGNRTASIRTLHEFMEDRLISEDLGFMLEGNLDMLNHDYLGAVAAYNQAMDFHFEPWPEITYNRGLAFILLDNYTNGCAELQRSAQEGFEPARRMLAGLCNF